jgi:predicted  nucleic acid-binding Zn-ribbon protein
METIITRDSDIIREYLAALDARERGLSPFGRLAATVKFAQLREELDREHLETTEDDLSGLRREIDERLNRSLVRRFEARRWGARLSAFLIIVLGQQLALAAVLAVTALFVKFAPVPQWWNKLLPHDEPALLVIFCLLFFFATPMLAMLVLCGGRYLKSFRITIPLTIALIGASGLGAYLVMRGKPNPILRHSSLEQLASARGVNAKAYHQWVDGKWLLKDPKFQSDYERFLRNGPGRWVTSRVGEDDASWQNGLHVINEYLDGGSDPNSFRDWLKYYLDRNRIYSEERIDQEVKALTEGGDQRSLGIWEVEPFLKERDERTYKAYLGSISHSLKGWGILELGLLTVIFIIVGIAGPRLGRERAGGLTGRLGTASQSGSDERGSSASLAGRRYSFPEKTEITSPPFFDTPFRILSRVHRSFVSLGTSTAIIAFVFWGVIYAAELGSSRENVTSQTGLVRSYLLIGSDSEPVDNTTAVLAAGDSPTANSGNQPEARELGQAGQASFNYAEMGIWPPLFGAAGEGLLAGQSGSSTLANRLLEVESRLDDSDYETSKKIKSLNALVASQANQIETLRALATQLQQATTPLPQQVQDLTSRTTAIEERVGQTQGDISAARQQVDSLSKTVSTKLEEADSKATHASEQAAKVQEDASTLSTRTEALEKELDRRARQIEAQTEELGNRTTSLKQREDELDRLEAVTFSSMLSELKEETQDLDRKSKSGFYRMFNKAEARRWTQSLDQRLTELQVGLSQLKTKETPRYLAALDEIYKQVQVIAARLK